MDKNTRNDTARARNTPPEKVGPLFDKAFARDESFPVPAIVQRLDADLERVFYSTQKNGRTERKPAARAEEAVPPAVCVEVCRLLNQALANCIDLVLQCKQAQWNVGGPDAATLAPLFGKMAIAAEEYADRIAARIAALGGHADGRLDSVAERSGLNRYPKNVTCNLQHVDAIASALGVMTVVLRTEIAGMAKWCHTATSSLLRGLNVQLESHLSQMEAQQRQLGAPRS